MSFFEKNIYITVSYDDFTPRILFSMKTKLNKQTIFLQTVYLFLKKKIIVFYVNFTPESFV